MKVVGEHGKFTPIATTKFIHARIKNSKLVIVKKAGHLPNMEQDEKFNSELKTFLGKNFKNEVN